MPPTIIETAKSIPRGATTSQDNFKPDEVSLRSLLTKATDPTNTKAFRPWEFEPAPTSARGN
jgi:hypothetical protein